MSFLGQRADLSQSTNAHITGKVYIGQINIDVSPRVNTLMLQIESVNCFLNPYQVHFINPTLTGVTIMTNHFSAAAAAAS